MRAEPCPAVGRGCRGAGLGAAPPPHMPTPPAPHRRCPPTQTARDGDGGCVELCRTAGRAPLLAQPPPPPPSAVPCTVWGGRAQEPWALKQEPHPRFPDLAFLFLFVFFFSFFPKHERCRRGRRRWGKGGGGRAAPRVPSGRGRAVPEPLWMLLAPGGVVVVQTRRAEAGTTHHSADTAASLQPARRVLLLPSLCPPPPPTPNTRSPHPSPPCGTGGRGGGGGCFAFGPSQRAAFSRETPRVSPPLPPPSPLPASPSSFCLCNRPC